MAFDNRLHNGDVEIFVIMEHNDSSMTSSEVNRTHHGLIGGCLAICMQISIIASQAR